MENRKFQEYIIGKYRGEIERRLISFSIENIGDIEESLRNGGRVHDICVEDFKIKDVRFFDCQGDTIEFKLTLSARIDFEYHDYRIGEDDSEHFDFDHIQMDCRIDIGKDELRNFAILSIDKFSKDSRKSMSRDLIPYIKKEEYEGYARKFLESYYPEVLKGATAFDPYELVKRMGLKIVSMRIKGDKSIFGKSYMKDTFDLFWDEKEGKTKQVWIRDKTIVIDKEAIRTYSFSCEAGTIIHECLHFYLHRKALKVSEILGESQSLADKSSLFYWMEMQAKGITPYVLLPTTLFKHKLDEETRICSQIYGPKLEDYIIQVIEDLAVAFNTSKYSVQKRLLDFGYEEIIGIHNYVDGHYLRNYFFAKGSLKYNETFSISYRDLLDRISFEDKAKLFWGEGLVFAENHVVLNDPKYIEKDEDGEIRLTDYGLRHMDECALKFQIRLHDFLQGGIENLSLYFLCRDESMSYDYKLYPMEEQIKMMKEGKLKEGMEKRKAIIALEKEAVASDQPIVNLRKLLGISLKELEVGSGLSHSTVVRYYNGLSNPEDVYKLVSLCISMKLCPDISHLLLKRYHFSLDDNDPRDAKIEDILMSGFTQSIRENNEVMIDLGLKPINDARRLKK